MAGMWSTQLHNDDDVHNVVVVVVVGHKRFGIAEENISSAISFFIYRAINRSR